MFATIYSINKNYAWVRLFRLYIVIFLVTIGYSRGDRRLAGYDPHNSGGECLKGFRMALQVLRSTGKSSSVYKLSI